jgi:hypothetical protein
MGTEGADAKKSRAVERGGGRVLDSWARCSRRKQPVVAPTFGRLGLAHGLVKRWAITARCAPDKLELHSTVERKSPGNDDEGVLCLDQKETVAIVRI